MNAEIEAAATDVIDCALAIHKKLGPGLFESVYEVILAHRLRARGYNVQRQVAVPIVFEELRFDEGFRADLIVNDKLLVELKSVEKISPTHSKQVLTYLRLLDFRLGLLLNFGTELLKDGIRRIAN